MKFKEFAEWLKTRATDSYSCSLLVQAALVKLEEIRPTPKFQIFMITEAYEAGVGKGHQAYNNGRPIQNPWGDEPCSEAWNLGYAEGVEQKLRQETK